MYTDIHPVVSVGYPKKKKTRLHAFIARSKKRGGEGAVGEYVFVGINVSKCVVHHMCAGRLGWYGQELLAWDRMKQVEDPRRTPRTIVSPHHTKMKPSSTMRAALLFLVLLLGHECIAVSNTIQNEKTARKIHRLESDLEKMQLYVENHAEEDVDAMFLEMENKQGMSKDEYATWEINNLHSVIRDAYTFEKSPVKNEALAFTELEQGKILSSAQIEAHRAQISSFLEKAVSYLQGGNIKSAPGNCQKIASKSMLSTCSINRECQSKAVAGGFLSTAKEECSGKCMCDTTRLNECRCVTKDTVDINEILEHGHLVESSFGFKGFAKTAGFGFIDGFFGGMAEELLHGFHDASCDSKNAKPIHLEAKQLWKNIKKFGHQLLHVHKNIFKFKKTLGKSFKNVLRSMGKVLGEIRKFMCACTGLRMVAMILAITAGFALIQLAIPVLGVIVGAIGALLHIFFSLKYIGKASWDISENVIKMVKHKCHKYECKKKITEKAFGIVGVFANAFVTSGMKPDFIKHHVHHGKDAVKTLLPFLGKAGHGESAKGIVAALKTAQQGETLSHKPVGVIMHKQEHDMVYSGYAAAKATENAFCVLDPKSFFSKSHHGKADTHVAGKSLLGDNAHEKKLAPEHEGEPEPKTVNEEMVEPSVEERAPSAVKCKEPVKGFCIDTREETCETQTRRGLCPGNKHVRCCPTEPRSTDDEA